jgi:adenine-specific DNA-methyltransferase
VLGPERATTEGAIAWLNHVTPRAAFVSAHFSPAGDAGRMYFTEENAARIDAARAALGDWHRDGLLGDDGFYLLVAALVEAADRVANTTGVYASYVKSWQPNARSPLHLRLPRIVPGTGSRALRAEARQLVRELEPFDLLYIDPPYNNRQYPAYYHVPEIIAMGWSPAPPVLRGKVGLLLHDGDKRSPFTSRRNGPDALEELIASAPCRHIALSYNAEGVIPEKEIARILKGNGLRASFHCYKRRYRRYRSDADSSVRRYSGNVVEERLYCVAR